MLRHIILFVVSCLLVFASPCFAVGGSQDDMPDMTAQLKAAKDTTKTATFFESVESIGVHINEKVGKDLPNKMLAEGVKTSATLKMKALALAGSLALLYLIIETVKHFGGTGSSSMINIVFDIAVPAVFAAYAINNYGTFIDQSAVVLDAFKLSGNPIDTILQLYTSVLKMIGDAVITSLKNFAASFAWEISMKPLIGFVDVLAVLLFSLIIFQMTLVSFAEIIGLILLGPFLFAVGVAFGPLMIAGIVTPWTKEYFGKWVNYLVASALLTGVVTVTLTIGSVIFNSINFIEFNSTDPVAITLGISAIFVMALNSLLQQAPAITSAMVPGGIGASKSHHGDFKKSFEGTASGAKITRAGLQKMFPVSKTVIK